jgi:hypothetical protein
VDPSSVHRPNRLSGERRLSRRAVVAASGLGAATVLGLSRPAETAAEEATPAPDRPRVEAPGVTFVYTGLEGSLTATGDEEDRGSYELMILGASDYTVYFSERMERRTGLLATAALVELWPFSRRHPANSALVFERDGHSKVYFLELDEPTYDAGQRLLRFPALVLDYRRWIDIASPSLGQLTLFIDSSIVVGEPPRVFSEEYGHRFADQLPLDDE